MIYYYYFLEDGSPEFDKFISLLGDKIRLKSWDKYRGGLDVKGKFNHPTIFLFFFFIHFFNKINYKVYSLSYSSVILS